MTRAALRELGGEIRHSRGQRWLQETVAHRIDEARAPVVVDGLRFPEDHHFLGSRYVGRFVHLHITAAKGVRRERFIRRGGELREFENALRHETEASIAATGALADLQLVNDATVEELRTAIDILPFLAR